MRAVKLKKSTETVFKDHYSNTNIESYEMRQKYDQMYTCLDLMIGKTINEST